jgi:membrane fusion protein (multidrug efflux system)
MKITRKQIFIGIAALLALGVVYRIVRGNGSVDPKRSINPLVKIELPHLETVVDQLTFTGDILPIQQANIYSKVNGNLEKIYVDIGTYVQQNQLLALIDTTELSQQEQEAAATFENARLTYQRNKDLFEQNLIARQDLDNAEATMKVSKGAYENAQTTLSYAHITAPFSGIITKRFLDQGANVTSNNTSLYILMDMESTKLIIDVPEKNIPQVAIGKKATLTVDAFPGRTFDGTVSRLSQAVDLPTRTMEVEIDIPNKDHLLKPGMFAHVSLVVREIPNSLTLPSMAILNDEKGIYVFSVDGTIAHRKSVTTSIELNGRTQILSGVSATDRIVTVGQQFVKDGAPVTIQQ